MKKNIAALAIILCVVSASPAFARGNNHGNYGGHNNRPYYSHSRDYHNRPYYSDRRGHHNDGLGIAFGVVGGLLLGSALMYSATPPPPAVVYSAPYPTYPPAVVVQQPPVVIVQQPSICVEDRITNGQWQISQYDGSRVWVSFPYPVTQRYQVPCN